MSTHTSNSPTSGRPDHPRPDEPRRHGQHPSSAHRDPQPREALRLDVADLLRRPGSRRDVHVDLAAGDFTEGQEAVGATRVAGESRLDAVLERVGDGIVVRGRVRGRWHGPCVRCLRDVDATFDCELAELYEHHAVEGETYSLEGDRIDLEPMLRDAVLPELPLAPHCRDDCRGLCPACGADRNDGDCGCDSYPPDPRWDALRELLDH